MTREEFRRKRTTEFRKQFDSPDVGRYYECSKEEKDVWADCFIEGMRVADRDTTAKWISVKDSFPPMVDCYSKDKKELSKMYLIYVSCLKAIHVGRAIQFGEAKRWEYRGFSFPISEDDFFIPIPKIDKEVIPCGGLI